MARFVVFVLGVATVIDALWAPGPQGFELVTGMVLLGLIPVDELLGALATRWVRPRKDD